MQVSVDRAVLQNIATVSNLDGSVTVRAVNQASVDAYGEHRVDLQVATDSEGYLTDLANWRVNVYGEPRPRVPGMSVDVTNAGGWVASFLFMNTSTGITVQGLPSQAPAASDLFVVVGWSESVSATGHMVTLNMVPGDVFEAFAVADATYGKLDTYPLGY